MKQTLKQILAEDVGKGDITSSLIPTKQCRAKIFTREPCVVAGLEEAKFLFKSRGVKATGSFKDGDRLKKGSAVLRLRGSNKAIFSVERTALNVLGRMSEVATTCAEAKKITGSKATVAITRKTMPGFNLFDKKAAKIAGVWPHRLNLGDAILLKENHLKFFASPSKAVEAAKKKAGKANFAEVEVESLAEAFDAAKAKPNIIMLDNFSPAKAKSAIKKLRPVFNGKIELSGGINLKNLKSYAKAKPDIISMGCLTYATKWLDFSLLLEK